MLYLGKYYSWPSTKRPKMDVLENRGLRVGFIYNVFKLTLPRIL